MKGRQRYWSVILSTAAEWHKFKSNDSKSGLKPKMLNCNMSLTIL